MTEHCANCGTDLYGGYCAECGQSTTDFDVPIGIFAREFASESFDLDSRLRLTLRTLILKPGGVAQEYVAGRRARFVPPARLYLFASFAMFLVSSFGAPMRINSSSGSNGIGFTIAGPAAEAPAQESPPASLDSATDAGSPAPAQIATDSAEVLADRAVTADSAGFGQRLAERFSRGMDRAQADSSAFTQDFMSRMAKAMIFLLPAFALLLKFLYRRRLYVHHLVYAIYFHSFMFMLMGLVSLPEALGMQTASNVLSILLLWLPVYLYLGMRRFYRESRGRTLVKFFALTFAYWIIGLSTMLGLLAFSLTRA